MTTLKGVDVSYGRLTPDHVARFRADDVRVVGQCLWTGREVPYDVDGPTAGANLQLAQAEGFLTIGYVSVTGWHPGEWHVDQGRAAAGDTWDRLVLAPVDVEVSGTPVDTVERALTRAAALGKRPCVYTRRNFWQEEMGDAVIPGTLLWNAWYDGDPDIDFDAAPFGGWTRDYLVGEQYRGGGTAPYGIDADLDVFVLEMLMAPELEQLKKDQDVIRLMELLAGDALRHDVVTLVNRLKYVGAIPA